MSKFLCYSVLGIMLVACSFVKPANPNAMTFKVESGQITAKYLLAGFLLFDVQRVVATQCEGGVVSDVRVEQGRDKGVFTAICVNGSKYSTSFGEAQKTMNGILVETTFSDSEGNTKSSSETL